MREPDRQRAGLKARLGRHQFSPHRIAAFAVEHFACAQLALGHAGDVAAKTLWLARGLIAQCRGQNRYVQFQPDQMIRLVHGRITPARIGLQAILPEAIGGGIIWGPQPDVDAPAPKTGYRAALPVAPGAPPPPPPLLPHTALVARPPR